MLILLRVMLLSGTGFRLLADRFPLLPPPAGLPLLILVPVPLTALLRWLLLAVSASLVALSPSLPISTTLLLALLILGLRLLLAGRTTAAATPRLPFRPLLTVAALLAAIAVVLLGLILLRLLFLLALLGLLILGVRTTPAAAVPASLRPLIASRVAALPITLSILVLIVQKFLLLRRQRDGHDHRGEAAIDAIHFHIVP